MTNREYLNSLTDDEVAKEIAVVFTGLMQGKLQHMHPDGFYYTDFCKKRFQEWLKAEKGTNWYEV